MSRSKKIRTLAALGTLTGAAWAGTFASFTDGTSSAATFAAGTVKINAGAQVFAPLTVNNLKPGDVRFSPLTLTNAGTLDFTYGMTASTTDTSTNAGLGAALQVAVKSVSATTGCTEAGWSAGADVVTSSGISAATFTGRPIASAGSDVLCFRVTFPNRTPALDNPLQGSATTATFSFTATTPQA
jgi:hypothetical protein